jgi:Domain of unknown function (DUF4920)
MKLNVFVALCAFVLMLNACSQPTPPKVVEGGLSYGEKITVDSAIQLADLFAKLDKKEGLKDVEIDGGNVVPGLAAKVEGKAKSVCKSAGCWVVLETADGKEMFVKVKDHAFKLPADVVGKTLVVNGNAYQNITSIEELRHYAKDDGKNAEEIAKIVEPKIEYQMTVNAVVMKK